MKQRTRTFVLGLLLLGAVSFGSPRLVETAHFSAPAIHSHAIGGSRGGTVSPIAGGKVLEALTRLWESEGGGITNQLVGGKAVVSLICNEGRQLAHGGSAGGGKCDSGQP